MTITEAEFLKDVSTHVVEVIRDDGLFRHIRFKRPGTMCMHFDLITWPGYLCYTGDMGTYVFRRLNDMFEFFRTDRMSSYAKANNLTLDIDPGYWGEKLEAVDRGDGFKEWSVAKFKKRLIEQFNEWADGENFSVEDKLKAFKILENDVLDCLEDGGKEHAYRSAMDCEIYSNRPFEDFYEIDTEEYTHYFIWCCYALAWGIAEYDKVVAK